MFYSEFLQFAEEIQLSLLRRLSRCAREQETDVKIIAPFSMLLVQKTFRVSMQGLLSV